MQKFPEHLDRKQLEELINSSEEISTKLKAKIDKGGFDRSKAYDAIAELIFHYKRRDGEFVTKLNFYNNYVKDEDLLHRDYPDLHHYYISIKNSKTK